MHKRMWWLVGGVTAAWVILIGALQYVKYHAFAYNGLDLGIYSQVLWSLSHGHGFASSIHDPSYLGDHLELWLVPVSALYRIWSHPLTALWSQTLVLALTVIPLSLITARIIGQKLVIVVVGLFLAHPLLYNAAMYEFHGLVFALPICFWMIWTYLRQQYAWWLVGLVLLLFVREDMPLMVLGWAIYGAIERRNWRWWAVPALLGVGYFLAAQGIIRAANPLDDYKYLAFYQWLGSTPAEMVTFPFRHPLVFLGHIFSVYNWQTVIGFLITFGGLPLLGLRRLWPACLVFVQLLFLGAPGDSILRLHYVIPYLPWLVWASLEGWHRLQSKKIFARSDQALLSIGATILAIVGPLYGHFLYGPLEWPWKPDVYASRTPAEILQAEVKKIQPDERVLTTFNLLPALSQRQHVYSINYVHLGRRQYTQSEYIVPTPIDVAIIDGQQYYDFQFLYRDTLYKGKTGADRLADILQLSDLQLAKRIDGVAIYRRGAAEPDVVISAPGGPATQPLQLIEHQVQVDQASPSILKATFGWEIENTPPEPWSINFQLYQNNHLIWSHWRLLGSGLQPANEWTPDQVWRTNYQVTLPKQLQGEAELKIKVAPLSGRMRLDRWRSFVPRPVEKSPVFQASLGRVEL